MTSVARRTVVLGVVGLAGILAVAVPPATAQSGIKVGALTCNVAGGWGFIFGSSRDVTCTFAPQQGSEERYTGKITKFGVDIGYSRAAVMVWAVWAPSTDVRPGALAGDYAGVAAGAAVGVGAGANVLVGGFNKSFTLQPVSIEGSVGLNVAAGVTAFTLQAAR